MAAVGVCLGFDLGGLRPRGGEGDGQGGRTRVFLRGRSVCRVWSKAMASNNTAREVLCGIRPPSLVDTWKYRRRRRGMSLGQNAMPSRC